MLKAGVGLLGMALVTLVATVGPQNGCRDAKVSLTHIDYWPYRDMRKPVASCATWTRARSRSPGWSVRSRGWT